MLIGDMNLQCVRYCPWCGVRLELEVFEFDEELLDSIKR
jgi:hypothetical protein